MMIVSAFKTARLITTTVKERHLRRGMRGLGSVALGELWVSCLFCLKSLYACTNNMRASLFLHGPEPLTDLVCDMKHSS